MGGTVKTIYLILGSIGSGKSVVADFILSDPAFKNIEYVGSDIYKRVYYNRDIKVDKRGYRCSDELVFHRIEQICQSKDDFVYEFCPSNLNKIETLKYIMRKYNYKFTAFFVGTENQDINIKRCKSRETKGADTVSEEKIRRRYSEALNRIIELIDLAEKMYFIDNSKDTPRIISHIANNKIEILDHTCKWFNNNIAQKLI